MHQDHGWQLETSFSAGWRGQKASLAIVEAALRKSVHTIDNSTQNYYSADNPAAHSHDGRSTEYAIICITAWHGKHKVALVLAQDVCHNAWTAKYSRPNQGHFRNLLLPPSALGLKKKVAVAAHNLWTVALLHGKPKCQKISEDANYWYRNFPTLRRQWYNTSILQNWNLQPGYNEFLFNLTSASF